MRRQTPSLAAAENQHEQTTSPLYDRLEHVKAGIRAAREAREQLVDTCMIPHFIAELDQVRAEQASVNGRRAELQLRIKDFRDRSASDREEMRHATTESRQEILRQRAADLSARAAEMENELADVLQRLEVIDRQERSVIEKMLVP